MSEKFNKSISVVVPVYNEAEIIEETILYFIKLLSNMIDDFEIIIVDDASSDGTDKILDYLAALNKNIKVFRNAENIGSGGSLWRGIGYATKDLILTNFADRPFDLADLKKPLSLFDKDDVDFVIVIRKDRGANNLYRKITSYANYLLIKFLFNLKIKDFQFVQIYKKQILKKINIISRGTFVPPEIILRLISGNYRYKQIKCVFHKRKNGKSKCGNLKEILNSIREILFFKILTLFRLVIL